VTTTHKITLQDSDHHSLSGAQAHQLAVIVKFSQNTWPHPERTMLGDPHSGITGVHYTQVLLEDLGITFLLSPHGNWKLQKTSLLQYLQLANFCSLTEN
jgi:hypothetical protein